MPCTTPSAVFEGERDVWRRNLQADQHTERLHRSAGILDFEIPFSAAEIDAGKAQTLANNGLDDAYLRPIAWRGSEMIGVSAQKNKIHLAIAAWDWPSYFEPEQRIRASASTSPIIAAPIRRPRPRSPRRRAST